MEYCLLSFKNSKHIDAVQIVADPQWRDVTRECAARAGLEAKLKGFSLPGKNRQQSILNGLEDICRYAESQAAVIVHDAARPGVSPELLERSLEALPTCKSRSKRRRSSIVVIL